MVKSELQQCPCCDGAGGHGSYPHPLVTCHRCSGNGEVEACATCEGAGESCRDCNGTGLECDAPHCDLYL